MLVPSTTCNKVPRRHHPCFPRMLMVNISVHMCAYKPIYPHQQRDSKCLQTLVTHLRNVHSHLFYFGLFMIFVIQNAESGSRLPEFKSEPHASLAVCTKYVSISQFFP